MAMHLDGGHRIAARLTALTLLAGLCALAFLLSIGAGAVNLSLGEVWRALFVETSGVRRQIVFNLRLPRALAGAMVGACLAVSGVLLQAVMRNPLASPSVIGVSSGAGFFGMLGHGAGSREPCMRCCRLRPSSGGWSPPWRFISWLGATASTPPA